MASRLVRLSDGILVEVDVPGQGFENMSAGDALQATDAAIGKAAGTVVKVCEALAAAVRTISSNVKITAVDAQVGLSFEVEGNLYIAKSKGSASITVKVSMGPP